MGLLEKLFGPREQRGTTAVAASIEGSVWEDADRKNGAEYRFRDQGRLEYVSGPFSTTPGTWEQSGKTVCFRIENHYQPGTLQSVWNEVFDQHSIRGTARVAQTSQEWTFKLSRVISLDGIRIVVNEGSD